MTRNAWIAALLVATAAGLWLVITLGSREPRARRADAEADADTEAVQPDSAEEPAPDTEPTPEAHEGDPAEAPAPEPEAPEAKAAENTAAVPVADLPPPERSGPVDDLKERFTREPRESSAGAAEKEIEAAFRNDQVPPALLKSILCRSTVCRVETAWSPERATGFMTAFTRLLMPSADGTEPSQTFDSNLAISPEGDPDANGARMVDVYIQRLPPPAAAP